MKKMSSEAKYLIAVHVLTTGLQDDDLGSDEEEIVVFSWLVIDTNTSKILERNCHYVKPKNKDINDNILAEISRESTPSNNNNNNNATANGLPSNHVVVVADDNNTSAMTMMMMMKQQQQAQSLESVLSQLDSYINAHLGDHRQSSFCIVTDGQLHLRQALHPEANKKAIPLPDYYYRFFDLRKEFRKCYRNNDMRSVDDMLEYLTLKTTQEMNGEEDPALCRLQNISSIIVRMIDDGHKFDEFETINEKLEPGICTKNEFVDNNTVVRARGLPWQSSDQDIANFFSGLNIVKGGVALCLSVQGRRNGEALVRFVNQEHRDMALRRHKHHIGQRYIEVYRATGEDFLNVAGGNNNEAQTFLSRGGQAILRMRGLPYDCTAQQVIDFFAGNERCDVMHGEDGVLFVRKPDGRPTGDAFVLFQTEDIAVRALQKHRESIGTRYIELFRSTNAEVQQVFNRNMETRNMYDNSMSTQPLLTASLVNPMLHANSRKDCIRLRGLPYEAQVEQILAFLGEHSKKIIFQGVHMVYNAQGQPSGEAFIQMDSEPSASLAAQQRHHRYMIFGKKQRYIEVFQCSVDDMNLTSGAIHSPQRPLLSSAGALLSNPFAPFPHFSHLSPQVPAHHHHHHPNGSVASSASASAAAATAAALAAAAAAAASHPVISLNGGINPAVSLASLTPQQAAAVAAAVSANGSSGSGPGATGGAAAGAGPGAGAGGRLPPASPFAAPFPNPNNPFNLIYWHYPSPPVSPTAYFAAHSHTPSPAMVNMRGIR